MAKHAVFSPSGFKALMICAGKPAMEEGLPDESSEYSDEGTAAHLLGSTALIDGRDAAAYLNTPIVVRNGEAKMGGFGEHQAGDRVFPVSGEMIDAVQIYLDTVRSYLAADPTAKLYVEQALPIGHITGEEGAEGTGDAIIVGAKRIVVIDLKYGRGVEVSVDGNPQPMIYLLGALEKFDLVGDVEELVAVISQPRVNEEAAAHTYKTAELMLWGAQEVPIYTTRARAAFEVKRVHGPLDNYLQPHEEACRFCKARATCGPLSSVVTTSLKAEFTDLTTTNQSLRDEIIKANVAGVLVDELSVRMDAVELIEQWCKAIRGRVEKELLGGRKIAGWKLIEGRKGNRAWSDETEAEKVMKSMRLRGVINKDIQAANAVPDAFQQPLLTEDPAYERVLISPTKAEKLLKAYPKRWARVEALISRTDGKPSVAPAGHKSPALDIKPIEAEFTVISNTISPDVVQPLLTAEDLI